MKKELQGVKDGPEAESLSAVLKKGTNWKMRSHVDKHEFLF